MTTGATIKLNGNELPQVSNQFQDDLFDAENLVHTWAARPTGPFNSFVGAGQPITPNVTRGWEPEIRTLTSELTIGTQYQLFGLKRFYKFDQIGTITKLVVHHWLDTTSNTSMEMEFERDETGLFTVVKRDKSRELEWRKKFNYVQRRLDLWSKAYPEALYLIPDAVRTIMLVNTSQPEFLG